MFERRLKIFLGLLIVVSTILLVRALQVQIVGRQYWREQASKKESRQITMPTSRGRILDCMGRELAVDQPCVDACVDFRAIRAEPDKAWLRERVTERIAASRRDEFRRSNAAGKDKIRAEEEQVVRDQIQNMWDTLARESHQTPQAITELRQQIEAKVLMRQRSQWYKKYQAEVDDKGKQEEPPAWYRSWVTGNDSDAPQIDSFDEDIEEERSPHVIVSAIDTRLANLLNKHIDEFPGLRLMPGTHRVYPFGEIGCHVIGHMTRVVQNDLLKFFDKNDLRRYTFTDLKGRAGLEALAEPSLRGTRGIQIVGEDGRVVQSIAAVPGADVRATIDIELQTDLVELLRHTQIPYTGGYDTVDMHGAIVVIDVPSSQVRALVSNPCYDLNTLDENYDTLVTDQFGRALLNRATQAQLEPGSTVKPVVGIGAITQGVLRINEGIECTGYLVIGKTRYSRGRCWTASKFGKSNPDQVAHHQIPPQDPHKGDDINPPGFLTFTDAIQRSCNVFFETTADRLQIEGLSYWMKRFGLGRPTGIGIAEACGKLPEDYTGARRDFTTWTAGIGQGCVNVTPIQMANVAATIARDGIWMRPRLLSSSVGASPYSTSAPSVDWDNIPDREDLKLSKDALEAARQGMIKVVNTRAGTGQDAKRDDMIVAGKTGTAEASAFALLRTDPATGAPVLGPDGKKIFDRQQTSIHGRENPKAAWYRGFDEDGTNIKHSWFIGFAPADHPQVAVAVMVEYGGSGGTVAGVLAGRVLDSLAHHGYLKGGKADGPEPVANSQ